MKKSLSFLCLFVLLTAFTCENEPLEGDFELESENPNTNTGLVGTWYAVSFSADIETTSSVNGMDINIETSNTGVNMDYTVTFTLNTFTTSGSYDVEATSIVNGVPNASITSSLDNVNGNGTYTSTATTITTDGAFYSLQIDGIPDSAFSGEQTTNYTISADGQTLTFNQVDTQNQAVNGITTTINIDSNSVWSKTPPDDNQPNDPDILGTWKLTAWNVEDAIDMNGDGTANNNLLDEMNCYDNETLVFNADNSGTNMSTSYAEFNTDLVLGTTNDYTFTINCIDEIENTGFTWSQNGNTVTIGDATSSVDYTLSGNELSITIPEGFQALDSTDFSVTVTADLTFVYTKQ